MGKIRVKIRVKNACLFKFFNLNHVLLQKIVSIILKFEKKLLFTCKIYKKYFSATFPLLLLKFDSKNPIKFLSKKLFFCYFWAKKQNFSLPKNSSLQFCLSKLCNFFVSTCLWNFWVTLMPLRFFHHWCIYFIVLLTCWQCFSCFNVLLWFLSSFWPQLKRVQIRDMR